MRWKRLSYRVSSAAQLCPLRKSLTLLVSMFLWCTNMTCAFSSTRTALRVRYRTQQFGFWSTRSNDIHSVAIIGGGLAGLSTAHHFIQKQPGIQITIFDKAPVGTAGASSVAGGLLHPLSPRGKLVYQGRFGLQATNELVEQANRYQTCVVSESLFRVALNDEHVQQLKQTARTLPEYCEWISPQDMTMMMMQTSTTAGSSPNVQGGLKLSNGCKVLHVPSYLQGLYMACQAKASGNITWTLLLENTCSSSFLTEESPHHFQLFNNFDAVVLAAGAGMFQNDSLLSLKDFPVDFLIRGQSIEMKLVSPPPRNGSSNRQNNAALLCGKYISPLFEKNRVLIGATHEWSSTPPLSTNQVIQDLRQRTIDMAPFVWKHGEIANVTCGYRVQSRRGPLGRLPIIGRLHDCTDIHNNVYIFTGLSSRGLLYHGLYGDVLTDMILGIQEHESGQEEYNLDWWRKC
mmetsp:Transcript_10136/g.18413  ORF Transcript_10136/g.18413 Transcript_10136/m.18413 type:complete len:459 (+) Transcript_10136:102-1478(+)